MRNLENIIVKDTRTAIPFSPIGGPRGKEKIPERDREKHGDLIKKDYQNAINQNGFKVPEFLIKIMIKVI